MPWCCPCGDFSAQDEAVIVLVMSEGIPEVEVYFHV